MSEIIIAIIAFNIIFITFLFYIISKHFEKKGNKKIKEIIDMLNIKMEHIDTKFIINIYDNTVTNIGEKEIEQIKEKIKKNEKYFDDYKIIDEGELIVLHSEHSRKEVEELKERYEEQLKEYEKIKDKEYYFYKEFVEKLTYILSEINEFHREIKDISNLNIKFKLDNIKDKVEFLLEFFKEKGNIEFHKYRLYRIKNLVEMLKEEFDGKMTLDFRIDNNTSSYYIEMEKIYILIKAMLYSVLKLKISEKDKSVIVEIGIRDGYIYFMLKNDKSSYSFVKLIDEDFMFIDQIKAQKWKFSIDDSMVTLEVPIKNFEGEQSEEVKSMVIASKLPYIKDVIAMVLYDMNKYGFNNNEIYDMRLTLDELLVNAIEHGNKFNDAKKVNVNYKFLNDGKKVIIEIEDEGDGFDINNIKEPDILSMRGRGISIIKKLVNELTYMNEGRKVLLTKEKEV